jgi:predicted nucleic acid-binding protein
MAVVDASVILAAILPGEPDHKASKAWLDNLIRSGNQFSAPAILLSEVAAPLGRAYNQPNQAKQLINILMSAPYANLVPITLPLASRAAIIAADYKIRGCDSLYVALAESLNEELITLDKQQGKRANSLIQANHP